MADTWIYSLVYCKWDKVAKLSLIDKRPLRICSACWYLMRKSVCQCDRISTEGKNATEEV